MSPPYRSRKIATRQQALAGRAHHMRHNQTASEARLWAELRGGRLGVAFRRQVVIGPYIADFVAPSVGLVVEVDGGVHVARAAQGRAARRAPGAGRLSGRPGPRAARHQRRRGSRRPDTRRARQPVRTGPRCSAGAANKSETAPLAEVPASWQLGAARPARAGALARYSGLECRSQRRLRGARRWRGEQKRNGPSFEGAVPARQAFEKSLTSRERLRAP
jgi:hypothetical protein